ncbi:hypothetical protein CKQ80_00025 [Pseudomonas moraviensis]|uniref:Dyp-type peroxidase C-terminal domain-containing protein n=1 Tax=Pseudomonas moraviensis TaxID=321662 RepID=A0A2A2PDT4_9PSED|nr:hypothetical protein CKQ80_00025 [Pseudomonas moraviensis]
MLSRRLEPAVSARTLPTPTFTALRDIVKNLPDLLLVRWNRKAACHRKRRPNRVYRRNRRVTSSVSVTARPTPTPTMPRRWTRLSGCNRGSDEPAWATHGSYQAVRIIRNFVERWTGRRCRKQESIIGRVKTTGAPMGAHHETEVPDYSKDPQGKLTKLDAHIRLANPRTAASQANLILRRPFNYSNGVNKNGQLDMGLLFICYQADLEKASSPCRPGSTASRLRIPQNRSAAVTSSPCRVSPATRTSSVARCLTPPTPKQLPNHKKTSEPLHEKVATRVIADPRFTQHPVVGVRRNSAAGSGRPGIGLQDLRHRATG